MKIFAFTFVAGALVLTLGGVVVSSPSQAKPIMARYVVTCQPGGQVTSVVAPRGYPPKVSDYCSGAGTVVLTPNGPGGVVGPSATVDPRGTVPPPTSTGVPGPGVGPSCNLNPSGIPNQNKC